MSWMDSWSRPSKQANFPPPIYLTAGDTEVPYCHTCGRVITPRKGNTSASTSSPVKYCSERCRRTKPGKKDRQIEDAFVALLNDDRQSYVVKYQSTIDDEPGKSSDRLTKSKGDPRFIIWCSDVENMVFGSRYDPEKTAGRKKNRTPRGVQYVGEWKSVDMEDEPPTAIQDQREDTDGSEDIEDFGGGAPLDHQVDRDHISFGAGKRRPSQSAAEVNGSVGGEKGWAEKIEETDEMLQKRLEGQKRAEEREMVRRAARRGVAFGFINAAGTSEVKHQESKRKKGSKGSKHRVAEEVETSEPVQNAAEARRKCEAVITKAAIVVEPSFAKGDWGVRWRELS